MVEGEEPSPCPLPGYRERVKREYRERVKREYRERVKREYRERGRDNMR
jgi:hypothetical protein